MWIPASGMRFVVCGLLFLSACRSGQPADPEAPRGPHPIASVAADTERVWIAPDVYANRLLDWRAHRGRIECRTALPKRPLRTLHSLTRYAGADRGELTLAVTSGWIEPPADQSPDRWRGFLLGVGGPHVDPRLSALVHHWPGADGGLLAVLDDTGRCVFRDNEHEAGPRGPGREYPSSAWPLLAAGEPAGELPANVRLELAVRPVADGTYELTLTARASDGRVLSQAQLAGVAAEQTVGNFALVSHGGARAQGPGAWFRDWTAAGSKLMHDPERAFGPVVSTLYTHADGVWKLTAQSVPLGPEGPSSAHLELHGPRGWETVGTGTWREGSATLHFRVPLEVSEETRPYRVVVALDSAGVETPYVFPGELRAPPRDGFVLGALSCVDISSAGNKHWNSNHIWYPHADLVRSLRTHDPDLLFFAGDQLYEGGLAGIVRSPTDVAELDYLYHWYRFCWAFRDLMRDRPTIALPDDHDVYHGNIWGAGGVQAPPDPRFRHKSDRGGYMMAPEFVNSVHATQVAHLPDPFDATPLVNGVSVYTTQLDWGGLSFAILADRMWKSAPAVVMPEAQVVNGWIQNDDFDPRGPEADPPEAQLLGPMQLAFLEEWASDWSETTWMKVVLSQTIFSNVATIPSEASSGAVLPRLAYAAPGEYVLGDKLAADCDSNAWPRSGRNRALSIWRKARAFHVAGDQHLSSFTRYGIDDFEDAGYAFCVPAVANLWPRRFFPPPAEGASGPPSYTGPHRDGFGNPMTVLAVANPVRSGVEPTALHDRNPGYGIVRFDPKERRILSECWPRWVDPQAPGARQYSGWPIHIDQESGDGRRPAGFLPTVQLGSPSGLAPVVQVRDQETGEVVSTWRPPGPEYRPPVFSPGPFTVRIVGPGGAERVFTDLHPGAPGVLDGRF